jgi:hypothetical protein
MRCPKCQFDQTTECLKCGIVFSRYQAAQEAAAKKVELAAPAVQAAAVVPSLLPSVPPTEFAVGRNDALKELKYRALALPLALWIMTQATAISTVWLPCQHSVAKHTLSNASETIAVTEPVNLLRELCPEIVQTVLRQAPMFNRPVSALCATPFWID